MKRIIRELFRTHAPTLHGIDIVVRMLKPFGQTDYVIIKQEFIILLEKLTQQTGKPVQG